MYSVTKRGKGERNAEKIRGRFFFFLVFFSVKKWWLRVLYRGKFREKREDSDRVDIDGYNDATVPANMALLAAIKFIWKTFLDHIKNHF